jgi:hypothetical protein
MKIRSVGIDLGKTTSMISLCQVGRASALRSRERLVVPLSVSISRVCASRRGSCMYNAEPDIHSLYQVVGPSQKIE